MERETGSSHTLLVHELINTTATPRLRSYALIVSAVLLGVVLVVLPYAHIRLQKIPAFVISYIVLAIFAYLLTAFLLFGQFLRTRVPAPAILATSYSFTGLITISYTLTFPDNFSAIAFLHANTQTASWLWIFWHTGFPLGILLYTLIENRCKTVSLSPRYANITVAVSLFATLSAVVALTIIAIDLPPFLPLLSDNEAYNRITTTGIGPAMLAIAITAWGASLWRVRRGTVLQVWVSVAAFTYVLDVTLNLWADSYYSFGWYLARVDSFAASIVVLCALVYEVNHLYKKIAQQNTLMEQQNTLLEQQNILQRNFVSTVGHEFRTALTSIQGFSALLHDEDFSTQEVKDYAGDMNHEAQRLSRLISDLLDLDRMKDGKTKLQKEPLDINTIVEEVVHRTASLSEHHSFRLDLEPCDYLLSGDRDKLIQVLTNLISNAIKYSPAGGEVLLRSRREGAMMHLSVHDYGIGIPHEKLEEVFERYHRIETEQTRYVVGTGLGLPLVRQIVDMHGGKTWAESTPGQGSVFHVMLPIEQTPLPVQVRPSTSSSAIRH